MYPPGLNNPYSSPPSSPSSSLSVSPVFSVSVLAQARILSVPTSVMFLHRGVSTWFGLDEGVLIRYTH